ncbi:MAG TPA: hypothetical protein VEF71_18285 [Streptosporangiaceae bacterium]|nr:hypothetical protein [Streptosporangiaceae bacterium]
MFLALVVLLELGGIGADYAWLSYRLGHHLPLAGFAARLKDTVDLDSVRDDLAGVVHQALEPAHVPVWISERG